MNQLKICFVGIGSIANRHIRNLRAVCEERGIALTIDAYRRVYEETEGVDSVYCLAAEMPNDYDAVFITNPTNLHLKTLEMFHEKSKHFFIEKPVVSLNQIEDAERFVLHDNSVYYIACPLRYNAVIQYIKKHINLRDVISVRCISSSYLPEWRPGRDYRETYSAHKNMGGGVSIDLIHEWDYLTYLFGMPCIVHSLIGKKSKLEIDSDDYAIYIAEYGDMVAEIHLDYFGRHPIREIQLFTKDDTIVGNILENKIMSMRTGKCIDFHEERDDFQKRELIHFINMVEGMEQAEEGFHNGIQVLRFTQGEKV